jgi:DNA polymerase-3 subunit beta
VTTPGSVALPGKKLHEIVKELPSGDIHINGTGNRITISCGQSSFTLSGSSRDSFPALPSHSDSEKAVLPMKKLGEAIRKTAYAVARDDYRPALNGALWKLDSTGLEIVATDGHRLARIRLDEVGSETGLEAIVAPKALNLLARLAEDDEVQIRAQGTQISFEFAATRIFSRTIEGPYPPYEKVIPADNDMPLAMSREDLIASLRRMRIIANPATHQVRFTLEPGNIVIQAENTDAGEARETLDGDYSSDPLSIGFNGDFLFEILRNMDSERVVLMMKDSSTAVLIEDETPEEGVTYLALLMPVKLPSAD